MRGREVDGTGSASCPTAGFDIRAVELSGSAITELILLWIVEIPLKKINRYTAVTRSFLIIKRGTPEGATIPAWLDCHSLVYLHGVNYGQVMLEFNRHALLHTRKLPVYSTCRLCQ
jgi:hypothetical protein